MAYLLSHIPLLAWILIFLILLLSVSYLHVKNKNLGKIAIRVFFTLALIGGWSYGKISAEETKQAQVS